MDVDIFTSWVSQPDVCRCCLSTSGNFDLTASFLTGTGVLEIYNDMLLDCFGITLSHLSEWGPSRFICSVCAKRLRDACSFKKQVLVAEKHFSEYFSRTDNKIIKLEEEQTQDSNDDDDEIFHDDAAHSVEGEKLPDNVGPSQKLLKITVPSKQIVTKFNSNLKVIKPKLETQDFESNIPLAYLFKKNEPNKKIRFVVLKKLITEEVKGVKDCKVRKDVVQKGPPQLKQLSERKRIIITCETILKDTTACPFRHHKSWFQCFFCTQDFMEINTLRQHTLTTHQNVNEELKKIKRFPRSLQIEISNLKCRHCDLTLTDVNSLRGHFLDVHKIVLYKECIADYKVNSSPYNCHLCEKTFHVFRTLTTHLNEHYANCICDVCGKSFLNSKRLKVHKRTHEHGDYPCKECGKVLKTKTSEANHMESAHSKRVIKCQICFKPMKHYNERVKHMSVVHGITHKFVCPICSREYNIKHYLATHIRQTHGNKNKKCSECSMVFITNHGLKKHMLKHSGVKAYSCEVCCKSYARSYTLKEHMRCHETEKVGNNK